MPKDEFLIDALENQNLETDEETEQNKLDFIKAMIKRKISYKDISDISGKTIEEIKEIENNL